MYHIKSAIVISDVDNLKSEFKALIAGNEKYDVFRILANFAEISPKVLSGNIPVC